ncbi:MAG: hypothetical protein KF895_04620 [Parvibaculum sp.]|nr:hypothetical protein [Parvibaculum sp.]
MGNTAHPARKAIALACLLSLAGTGDAAAESCPAPRDIHVASVDRAFVQERHIEGMSRPLVSHGRLRAEGDEIVWHMQRPFDVKTVITPAGISESVDGGPLRPSGAGAAELGAGVARSAAALMRGQWDALSSLFNVSAPSTLESGEWEVLLTPLNARMRQAVGDIVVTGCADVERIAVGGDKGSERHVITFAKPDEVQ